MQATCAALGLLSSVAAWLTGATFWWLVGGVVLGAVIQFTLIVILPTNKQLLSATLDIRSAETERLLAHWGRLHAVRSVLSAAALLLFLYLAILEGAPRSFRAVILETEIWIVRLHIVVAWNAFGVSSVARPA
jgi:Domain of unknown function (DUF1772)